MKLVLKKALYPSLLGFSFMMSATGILAADDVTDDEDILVLSPFEVTQSEDVGYLATNTLAGTRLRTELKDIGSAVSVVTKEFLEDTDAKDNSSLLVYTTSTEVGGTLGNYTGANFGNSAEEGNNFGSPNSNTRVRGLTRADNTRNYFRSDIPWDGYNVSRVDLQRGPNAILFGLGSPSGIINTGTSDASFYNNGNVQVRVDENGSFRKSANVNRVILKDELAVRVAAVDDNERYRQKQAYENDQRFYVAVKYKPSFLQSDSMTTQITANYEKGNINRNSPRNLTPVDYITPWFASSENGAYGLGKAGIDASKVMESEEGYGQLLKNFENGDPNSAFLPALGDIYASSYGGPMAYFYSSDSATPDAYRIVRPNALYGLDKDGKIDEKNPNIQGLPHDPRMTSIAAFYRYAKTVELPYEDLGLYKNYHLTDSSVFNFYKNLLEGNNKHSWRDFEAMNVNLNQSFFNNHLGYEFVADHQKHESGSTATTSGSNLYIDINTHYPDGTKNPNFGRPFVSNNTHYGNGNTVTTRDSTRFTVFADYDFRDLGDHWWNKVLGRHVFTGLLSRDQAESERRSWLRAWLGEDYLTYFKQDKIGDTWSILNVSTYLGDSLADADTASGAYIPGISTQQSIGGTNPYWYFDSRWNADSSIKPGDAWDSNGDGTSDSTQSENPANYGGWTMGDFTVISADESEEVRNSLLTSAKMTKEVVDSKAFVWQAYLLDGGLVGTYGRREDTDKSYTVSAKKNSYDLYDIDESYVFADSPDENGTLKTQTSSWSVVAHINNLLGKHDFLPFNVSLYYNESDNFQPAASRVDIHGEHLAPPQGHTTDRSIAISTKDNRYTLKLTKFDTSVKNSNSSTGSIQTWFIGALESWGGNACNRYQYRSDYEARGDETLAEALAEEQLDIDAWRVHQDRIRAELPNFYKIWLSEDPVDPKSAANITTLNNLEPPTGFCLTEDTVSSGYELELIANPTSNWRISANVSKIEATRSNVGGDNFRKWVTICQEDIRFGHAGQIRTWSGRGSSIVTSYMRTIGGPWAKINLQDGSKVDELRKWHVNIVSNYTFNEGMLKGFNFGVGYRWMSENTIGYELKTGDDGNTTFDFDKPVNGPAQNHWDFWVGYKTSLTDKIDWKIQMNIKNAFTGDELIPLAAQPDGSIAAWSIAPHRVVSLTNTFTF